jgi:hypothetical protein
MIQIEDKIISQEIFDQQFVCDLNACKGACCVEGDSGAPLLKNEAKELEKSYSFIRKYLSADGKEAIKKQGFSVIDSDNDLTTPLVNNRECAYVFNDSGVTKCAIEKAYLEDEISFKKPISCHLYPIRITEYEEFDAVNYESNKICSPACKLGELLKVSVFRFLKEPLIRKYGKSFYTELEVVEKSLQKKSI